MTIVGLGADHAGFPLKEDLKAWLIDHGYDVVDFGAQSTESVDYPDYAEAVGAAVVTGKATCGVLVCGTGIGMAISANKVRGVRAAVAHDPYSLERSVRSNDCQVLCMGANVIAPALARSLLASWLDHRFDPTSPSDAKVAVIRAYEARGAHDDMPEA